VGFAGFLAVSTVDLVDGTVERGVDVATGVTGDTTGATVATVGAEAGVVALGFGAKELASEKKSLPSSIEESPPKGW